MKTEQTIPSTPELNDLQEFLASVKGTEKLLWMWESLPCLTEEELQKN